MCILFTFPTFRRVASTSGVTQRNGRISKHYFRTWSKFTFVKTTTADQRYPRDLKTFRRVVMGTEITKVLSEPTWTSKLSIMSLWKEPSHKLPGVIHGKSPLLPIGFIQSKRRRVLSRVQTKSLEFSLKLEKASIFVEEVMHISAKSLRNLQVPISEIPILSRCFLRYAGNTFRLFSNRSLMV